MWCCLPLCQGRARTVLQARVDGEGSPVQPLAQPSLWAHNVHLQLRGVSRLCQVMTASVS